MKFFYESLLFLTVIRQVVSVLTPQKKLMEILNSPEYDKEIRPFPKNGNATVVKLNMAVRDVLNIDEMKMEFTTQITLRQFWTDLRLQYDADGTDTEFITLNSVNVGKLWSPDLFFSNEARSYLHNIVKPNTFIRVFPSGNVMWSIRLTVTVSCPMDLHYFPFDKQTCSIKLSSYAITSKDMLIEWDSENPVRIPGNPIFSQFQLFKHFAGACTSRIPLFPLEPYSCVFLNLSFRRQFGFYLLNIYTPCGMCVGLSWISFWLGNAVSTRLSVTVTILLTLATQIQGFNQSGPKVSYVMALDIWTGFCLSFGALAILQSATIAYLTQVQNEETNVFGHGNKIKSMDFQVRKIQTLSPLAIKIDKISRIVFPLVFCLFVVGYIVVYVVLGNTVDVDTLNDIH